MNHIVRRVVATLILSCFLSGCALTTAQPARQLESGEWVYSGSVDMPGWMAMPRVSAQATYGFGPGDVSAHGGSAIFSSYFGAGLRLYPTSFLNLSVQTNFNRMAEGQPVRSSDWINLLTITPRISSVVIDGRPFYGGVQANHLVVNPWTPESDSAGLVGAFFGYERELPDNLSLQLETIISPVFYSRGRQGYELEIPFFEYGEPAVGLEVSVAIMWRPGQRDETPPRLEPTVERREVETAVVDLEEIEQFEELEEVEEVYVDLEEVEEPEEVEELEGVEEVYVDLEEIEEPEEVQEPEAIVRTVHELPVDERDDIQLRIRSRRHEITACYEVELRKDRTLEGELTVVFRITPEGSVTTPEIQDSTMDSSAMEDCILEAVKTWEFTSPEDRTSVLVDYPFRFSTLSSSP